MPIYEYKCQQFGEHIEIMQKISDAPLTECGKCQGVLEKQWSKTGFQFKGSGWYVTDYAKSGGTDSKKSDKGDKGETATEKTTPAESKSEPAKTETPKPSPAKSD